MARSPARHLELRVVAFRQGPDGAHAAASEFASDAVGADAIAVGDQQGGDASNRCGRAADEGVCLLVGLQETLDLRSQLIVRAAGRIEEG